jgi:hypothetical protein
MHLRIDFSAVCCRTLLQLVVAEIQNLLEHPYDSRGREPHRQQVVDEAITATQPPRLGPAGDIARLRRYLRLPHRRTPSPLPA